MTCCTGPTRCVGCEVDGIPLAGADWIADEWMAAMAPERRAGLPQTPVRARRRDWTPPDRLVAVVSGQRLVDRGGKTVRRGNPPTLVGRETARPTALMGGGLAGVSDRRKHGRRR